MKEKEFFGMLAIFMFIIASGYILYQQDADYKFAQQCSNESGFSSMPENASRCGEIQRLVKQVSSANTN